MLRCQTNLEQVCSDAESVLPWEEKHSDPISIERSVHITINELFDNANVYEELGKDVVYAFFQNCWHLKDWMIHDDSVKVSKETIEDFANDDDYLVICADLCNGSKHSCLSRIKKRPERGKDTDVKKTTIKLQIEQGEHEKKLVISGEFIVEREGTKYEVLELARLCVKSWDAFIANHKLPVS